MGKKKKSERDPAYTAELLVSAWLVQIDGIQISPEGEVMDRLRKNIEIACDMYYRRGLEDGKRKKS